MKDGHDLNHFTTVIRLAVRPRHPAPGYHPNHCPPGRQKCFFYLIFKALSIDCSKMPVKPVAELYELFYLKGFRTPPGFDRHGG